MTIARKKVQKLPNQSAQQLSFAGYLIRLMEQIIMLWACQNAVFLLVFLEMEYQSMDLFMIMDGTIYYRVENHLDPSKELRW